MLILIIQAKCNKNSHTLYAHDILLLVSNLPFFQLECISFVVSPLQTAMDLLPDT